MRLAAAALSRLLTFVGAILGAAPVAAAPPVALLVENAATSVWDTDASKVGVQLQVVNRGAASAEDVRVTSVGVNGGALDAAYSVLPIALGNVAPQGSLLLDLVISVPRTDGAAYLLTIAGTYRVAAALQRFTLTHTVTPSAAGPGVISGQSGVSGTAPSQPAGPVAPPVVGGGPPQFGPNAATPMLIPPGPPRQLPTGDRDGAPQPQTQSR